MRDASRLLARALSHKCVGDGAPCCSDSTDGGAAHGASRAGVEEAPRAGFTGDSVTAWLENVAALSIHAHQTLLDLDDVIGHLGVGFLEELHHLWMHGWMDGWMDG